jgi:NAD(P)-dependent dehydrogenase (short-subunit alcohol dehydrogenase family)
VYEFAPIESVTEEDFRAITGVLSRQLGARKIRVNTLNPGMVESVSQLTSYRSSCSWPRTILLVDRRGMPAARCTERRGTPAAVHPRARMRLGCAEDRLVELRYSIGMTYPLLVNRHIRRGHRRGVNLDGGWRER